MKFSKNVNNKKHAPQMIFFNENCFKRIRVIFDIKIWLWKYNFGTFCKTVILRQHVDSWPKILLFRTHHLWNSTTKLILFSIWGGSCDLPPTSIIMCAVCHFSSLVVIKWFFLEKCDIPKKEDGIYQISFEHCKSR